MSGLTFTLLASFLGLCLLVGFSDAVDPAKLPEINPESKNKYDFLKVFSGLYYQHTYKKINKHLVSSVSNDEVGANVEAARALFDASSSKKTFGFSFLNKSFLKGLQQFIALGDIKDDNMCNGKSYAILIKNDKATEGKTHKPPSKLKPINRIANVVFQAASHHAHQCRSVYPQTYKKTLAGMDPVMVNFVETFIDETVRQRYRKRRDGPVSQLMYVFKDDPDREHDDQVSPMEMARKVKTIRGSNTGKIAFNILKTFAAEDPDNKFLQKVLNELNGKMEVNKAKVRNLVIRYFIEPCDYYVKTLGPDVFTPAIYDNQMFELQERYSLKSQDDVDFYFGWIRFRLCKNLVKYDWKSLINGVIREANNHGEAVKPVYDPEKAKL